MAQIGNWTSEEIERLKGMQKTHNIHAATKLLGKPVRQIADEMGLKFKPTDRDGVFMRDGSFYISYRDHNGRTIQRKLKGVVSRTKAKELRNAELARVERARTLGYTEPTKDTFAEIIPRYLKHQKARLSPKAYERTNGIVETHLRASFGTMRLADIRRQNVQAFITKRLEEVSTDSVIKEVGVLKHLFGLAVEWELIPTNPAYKMGGKKDNMKASPGRVRYLQPTELRAVLSACPKWLRPIAGLLAFTGMRRSEVLGLRWLDVDRKSCRILLPQTKNGDGRIVPLNDLAIDVIDSLKPGFPIETIFPADITPKKVSLAFLRTCRNVGIANFRLHDLRHTFASHSMMAGADLLDVAALLGHRDLRQTKRYAHLSGDHLAAAARRLDSVFTPLQLANGTSTSH